MVWRTGRGGPKATSTVGVRDMKALLASGLSERKADTSPEIEGFLRHVRACSNAVLPGGRLAFLLGSARVGWLRPDLADALRAFPAVSATADAVRLDDPASMLMIARALSERGWFHWRGEAFDIRARSDGPVLAKLDRGALPLFGVEAMGVHVNGLVQRRDGWHLWVARRAADKALDPGKLDHIVAGGVPAGLSPDETLEKEAAEEAGIAADLARQADLVGTIRYTMERPEGLRRDILYCYDLQLSPEFRPHPQDGEVAGFELWPLVRVCEAVRDSDAFKFNVNLALIDLFIRRGLICGSVAARLRAALAGDGTWPKARE
jgi:8-oxo-dGTP pyrophosphatase MutT (NUDIX family)